MDRKLYAHGLFKMTFLVLYNHENRQFELCTRMDRQLYAYGIFKMTFLVLYNHENRQFELCTRMDRKFTHMEYLR